MRQLVLLLVCSAALSVHALCQAADSEQPVRLSDVISEGIGKRFPPQGAPVTYERWPLPLSDAHGSMMAAAITPDGKQVATGSGHPNEAGELILWDASTGKEVWVKRFSRGVRSLVFARNGDQVFAGGYDGVARCLSTKDGSIVREFRGHTDGVNSVCLTPDERSLLTASLDGTIGLWNVDDGKLVRSFKGHSDGVLSVAVSPDGRLVGSGSRDSTVRTWELSSARPLQTLAGHEAVVEMVAFSPDSKTIASASWDGTARLWECDTGKELASLRQGDTRQTTIAFRPEPNLLFVGGFDGAITTWDVKANKALSRFKAQNGAVFATALSKDGSRLVSCGFEGTARLWDPNGKLLQRFDRVPRLIGDSARIERMVWSPKGKRVAAIHGDGAVRVMDTRHGSTETTIAIDKQHIVSAAFSASGDELLIGTREGEIHLSKLGQGKVGPTRLFALRAEVVSLMLSGDKNVIACTASGAIRVVDFGSAKVVASQETGGKLTTAAIDPSGNLVTAHADGRLRWWGADDLSEFKSDIRLESPATAIVISPAKGELAVSTGQTVELWGIEVAGGKVTGRRQRALVLPDGEVTTLAALPRSGEIITGDSVGAVRIWGALGGAARQVGRKHLGGVSSVAVSPVTMELVTAARDGAAWLWTPERPANEIRPLAAIPSHDKGTRYVGLAAGNRLVSGGFDNHVRVWDLAKGEKEHDLGVPDTSSACTVTPEGNRVAVGHWSKRIQLVDLQSGERQENIRGLPRGPYAIAVSTSEDRMVAVFRELGAMVYDLKSFESDPVISLPPDELPYTHAAFAPDGESFATCTGDFKQMERAGKVRLHHAKSGAVIRSFDGHASEVKFVAFDSAGKRLVTTSGDKTVRVWEVESGKSLAVLPHAIGTFAAAFVPESDLLVTADFHGKVFVWDVARSEQLQEIPCHSDFVCSVVLSDDLSAMATGSRDGSVKLWRLRGSQNELRVADADAGR